MTTLSTKALGQIEIDPRQIVHFPDGLYGFDDFHEFALIEENPESPFKWLQSTADPGLAFIVIQPELFLKNPYLPAISSTELASLQAQKLEDCIIFVIVTIPENQPEKMTANLQGPVLIHREKKIGRQVISTNDSHLVRVSILEQLEK